ncbi:hypothetical protein DC030_14980, partial [Enterococcus faecalis]
MHTETDWRDVGSIFLASLLSVVLITLYGQQFAARIARNGRYLAAVVILVLIFTTAARLMVSVPQNLIYWFPIATLSMLLSVLIGVRLAIMITVMFAAMVGFIAPNSLELSMYM